MERKLWSVTLSAGTLGIIVLTVATTLAVVYFFERAAVAPVAMADEQLLPETPTTSQRIEQQPVARPKRPQRTTLAVKTTAPVARHASNEKTLLSVYATPSERLIVIPAGTRLDALLTHSLSTETDKVGDIFAAILEKDVVVKGETVLEQNTRLTGQITDLVKPGRVQGVAKLTLVLDKVGEMPAESIPLSLEGETTKAEDATKIGIGTGIGTAIGAIFGGGSGAGKGAVIGGGSGAGLVLATRGKGLTLPSEHRLTFVLLHELTIQGS